MGGIYLKILEEAGTTLCETAEPGFFYPKYINHGEKDVLLMELSCTWNLIFIFPNALFSQKRLASKGNIILLSK